MCRIGFNEEKKKGAKKSQSSRGATEQLLQDSDVLPFINIHYLTLSADGNMVNLGLFEYE